MDGFFDPVAIVGRAGRFPGCPDVDAYARLLLAGEEGLVDLTADDLRAAGVPDSSSSHAAYVRRAGLLDEVAGLDAPFFGMSPREAEICDPQLRLFLELTHAAIEDAGYDPVALADDVGVFGACTPNRYDDLHVLSNHRYRDTPDPGIAFLNEVDYLTTHTSYRLDLRGPSMAVATACSSGLSAIHLACVSLHEAECDAAVAGAATVMVPYGRGYRWSPGDVRSADGRCRPFDASASGTVFTNGAGVLYLKRLSDAVAAGDHVRAVIRSTAVTNDGSSKVSYSAPNPIAQAGAIEQAMLAAGCTPADVGYVEMHATGTPLGDPVELSGLTTAYRWLAAESGEGPPEIGAIPVGSVKGNIGHTIQAAGIAGVMKVMVALDEEVVPASIGVGRVNPRLGVGETPFRVATTPVPWPSVAGRPRRAGVSSLGVGGTNVHCVLEEPPRPRALPHRERPRLVLWSGRTEEAATANRQALVDHLGRGDDETFAAVASTTQIGRAHHAARGMVVARNPQEAARLLERARSTPAPSAGTLPTGTRPAETRSTEGLAPRRSVVFAFPGQGAQAPRMAAGSYGRFKVFTEELDCLLAGTGDAEDGLRAVWNDPGGARIVETAFAQPLVFAVEYALARQWMAWGVEPDVVVGHSLGELVAATVAGVFDPAEAMRLVSLRGRFMGEAPRGSMLAVAGSEEEVRAALPGGPGADVAVAARNGANQIVLCGPDHAIDEVVRRCADAGLPARRLPTSHAFHHPSLTAAATAFRRALEGATLSVPDRPLVSAASGAPVSAAQATSPDFWADQITAPVQFATATDHVLRHAWAPPVSDEHEPPTGTVVEVGPGQTLTRLLRRHPSVTDGDWHVVASLAGPGGRAAAEDDEPTALVRAAGELWLRGHGLEWGSIWPDEPVARTPVPTYRFQRTRHWVEAEEGPVAPTGSGSAEVRAAGRTDVARPGPFSVPVWSVASRETDSTRSGAALVLVRQGSREAALVVAAVESAGYEAVVRPLDEVVGGPTDGTRAVLDRDDVRLVLHAGAAGPPPGTAGASTEDADLDEGLVPLLRLLAARGRHSGRSAPPDLLVLTRNACDVTGDEATVPARSALVAAVRSAWGENDRRGVRLVDAGDPAGSPTWSEQLAEELRALEPEPVVAVRGARRWTPTAQRWDPGTGSAAPLPEGLYVVTGGLGGLGRALAEALVSRIERPVVALLGRSAEPEGEVARALSHRGVVVRRCDVADAAQLAAVLDDLVRGHGPLRGVFHLAGVAGGGMLAVRDPGDVAAVLRPKVAGTLALARYARSRPERPFVVAFSSRAASSGLVGGGDYAAANAFLDAVASREPGWTSIQWPSWSEVGMGAGGVVRQVAERVRAVRSERSAATGRVAGLDPGAEDEEWATGDVRRLSAATDWMVDEHRVDGRPVLPATGVVELLLQHLHASSGGGQARGEPLVLRDLTVLHPLVADRDQEVRVRSRSRGRGRTELALEHRPAGAEEWRVHSLATLVATEPATVVPTPPVHDHGTTVPLPSGQRLGGLVHGPRWHSLRRLTRSAGSGPGEVTADLELPEAFAAEARSFAAHPALLDAALATMRVDEVDGLLVPFACRELWWSAPLPPRVRAVASEVVSTDAGVQGDVWIVDEYGSLLVALLGLRLRRVEADGLTGDQTASGGDRSPAPHRPTAPATGPAPAASGAVLPPAADGLRTDEAVDLLWRILGGPRPPVVQVRGPEDQEGSPAARSSRQRSSPEDPQTETGAGAPGSDVPPARAHLAAIWAAVLGVSSVDPGDDFFDLGGDSLMAVALTGRVFDELGVEIGLGVLFDHPTLEALGDVVVASSERDD